MPPFKMSCTTCTCALWWLVEGHWLCKKSHRPRI